MLILLFIFLGIFYIFFGLYSVGYIKDSKEYKDYIEDKVSKPINIFIKIIMTLLWPLIDIPIVIWMICMFIWWGFIELVEDVFS